MRKRKDSTWVSKHVDVVAVGPVSSCCYVLLSVLRQCLVSACPIRSRAVGLLCGDGQLSWSGSFMLTTASKVSSSLEQWDCFAAVGS